MSSLLLEVHQFTRQTPQIEDIRGCVQRRWTLALYSVSTVPPPIISSATPSSVVHSSVLFYSIPNGGPVAMVWGVSPRPLLLGLNLYLGVPSGLSPVFSSSLLV